MLETPTPPKGYRFARVGETHPGPVLVKHPNEEWRLWSLGSIEDYDVRPNSEVYFAVPVETNAGNTYHQIQAS